MPSFPTDLLLGMDLISNSEFWIDLGTMQLRDPGNQSSAIPLFVLPRVANAEEATRAYSYVEEIMPKDEPERSSPGQLGDSVVHEREPGWSRGDRQEAVPEETPRTPIPSPATIDRKSARDDGDPHTSVSLTSSTVGAANSGDSSDSRFLHPAEGVLDEEFFPETEDRMEQAWPDVGQEIEQTLQELHFGIRLNDLRRQQIRERSRRYPGIFPTLESHRIELQEGA